MVSREYQAAVAQREEVTSFNNGLSEPADWLRDGLNKFAFAQQLVTSEEQRWMKALPHNHPVRTASDPAQALRSVAI